MLGVTGGILGDRIRSQEPWVAERWDEMNSAELNGENHEFSSGRHKQCCCLNARAGARDVGRGRALSSVLIVRSWVWGSK